MHSLFVYFATHIREQNVLDERNRGGCAFDIKKKYGVWLRSHRSSCASLPPSRGEVSKPHGSGSDGKAAQQTQRGIRVRIRRRLRCSGRRGHDETVCEEVYCARWLPDVGSVNQASINDNHAMSDGDAAETCNRRRQRLRSNLTAR